MTYCAYSIAAILGVVLAFIHSNTSKSDQFFNEDITLGQSVHADAPAGTGGSAGGSVEGGGGTGGCGGGSGSGCGSGGGTGAGTGSGGTGGTGGAASTRFS
jgi:hypothetical protein